MYAGMQNSKNKNRKPLLKGLEENISRGAFSYRLLTPS